MSTQTANPYERDMQPIAGIWDDEENANYPRWLVDVQCTDLLLGGAPKHPDVLMGWLRSRFDEDEDVRLKLLEHVRSQGIDVAQDVTIEQVWEQLKSFGSEQHGNGFLQDDHGLFMPSRCIKSMIKEATSIRFPYPANKWGRSSKDDGSGEYGGKSPYKLVAERLFVVGAKTYITRRADDGTLEPLREPDGTFLHIGHPTGPKGRVSTLNYFDYCVQPVLTFTLRSHPDYPTEEHIREILIKGQQLGLWAGRSMSYGQFRVTGFTRL